MTALAHDAATSQRRIPAPSKLLALTELPRALAELGSLGWFWPSLMTAPRGDGHPVLVLPGFVTTDASTRILRRYLTALGYDAHAWNLGRNLGPRAIGREGERLVARLEEIHAATGKTVSLVGWSLGGVMARLLAGQRPDLVRQVISLGSPFAGDPRASNVWRSYEALTGQRIDDEHTQAQLHAVRACPPVPATAIFSKGDGVVAWQNCRESAADTTDNIEVRGSHCGLGVNSAVLWAVADRLSQKEGDFKPFDNSGLWQFVYPSAGHA